MKRAFPQKVKPVLPTASEVDGMEGQNKQVPTEVNRRACTSAAMIGLAISMGASSLLLPRQNDRAVAAEPPAVEPKVATAPSAFEVAALAAPQTDSSLAESPEVEHTVQEGQTLWKLAQLYQVDAAAIAISNGIPTDAVLRVGQVLRIPAVQAVPQPYQVASTQLESVGSDVAAQQESEELIAAAASTDNVLKQEQEAALDRLKTKRNELKASLAELGAEESTDLAALSENAPEVPELTTASEVPAQPEVVAYQSPVPKAVEAPTAVKVEPQQQEAASVSEVAINSQSVESQPTAQVETVVVPSPEAAPANEPQVETVVVETQSPQVEAADNYRVGPGDTLDAIARKHGISRAELVQANQITDPNFIKVDQVIRIPQVNGVGSALAANTNNLPVPTLIASAEGVVVPTIPAVGSQPTVNSVAVEAQPEFKGAIASVPTESPVVARTAPEVVFPGGTPSAADNNQVAVAPLSNAPFAGSGSTQSSTSTEANNPYIENLKTEIARLREKYRTEKSGQQNNVLPDPAAIATNSDVRSASSRVNPEFSPSRHTEALQAEIRQLQQTRQTRKAQPQVQPAAISTPTVKPEQEKLVAAAPLGSDAYDPLVQPLVGQMVSPDLPPLAAADRYLPEGKQSFNGYIWPAKGVLTSGYGWRWGRMHKGIDIAAPVGTPVVAAAPGVVVTAGWNSGGYGNLVEIRHPDGSLTLYAHNNRIVVREGQQVEQGQHIADMGSTGYSTGPHSHFEVHLPGQGAVNPVTYLARS